MNIIIPMAGAGSRFMKEGYKNPKPFIDVSGKPMIKRVVENIKIEGRYIFLVQEKHLKKFPYMEKELLNLKKDTKIVVVKELTEEQPVQSC